jgi:hypothetical protein
VAVRKPGGTEEQEETAESGPPGNSEGSGTALGGPATSFFQIATEARSVVYVIDRSASMGLNRSLDIARKELLASLNRLPATARFQVIAYNRAAEPLPLGDGGLVVATAENKERAASFIQTLDAEGDTAHVQALKRALALRADVIYFLTDADGFKVDQVRPITSLNHGRSVIHAVHLAAAESAAHNYPLELLAFENHGIYKCVREGR